MWKAVHNKSSYARSCELVARGCRRIPPLHWCERLARSFKNKNPRKLLGYYNYNTTAKSFKKGASMITAQGFTCPILEDGEW